MGSKLNPQWQPSPAAGFLQLSLRPPEVPGKSVITHPALLLQRDRRPIPPAAGAEETWKSVIEDVFREAERYSRVEWVRGDADRALENPSAVRDLVSHAKEFYQLLQSVLPPLSSQEATGVIAMEYEGHLIARMDYTARLHPEVLGEVLELLSRVLYTDETNRLASKIQSLLGNKVSLDVIMTLANELISLEHQEYDLGGNVGVAADAEFPQRVTFSWSILSSTGLEEKKDIATTPVVPARGVQRFVGMFRDGKSDQLVDDSDIGPHLNLDLGNRETFVVDFPGLNGTESAALPSDIFLLHQTGAEVPTALRGIPSVEFADFEEVKAILERRAREGRRGGVAFVAPTVTNPDEWDKLFRAYGVTGIRMTPNTVEVMNQLNQTDLALFLLNIQSQKVGLILETGLEERTNGARRLFLDA